MPRNDNDPITRSEFYGMLLFVGVMSFIFGWIGHALYERLMSLQQQLQ